MNVESPNEFFLVQFIQGKNNREMVTGKGNDVGNNFGVDDRLKSKKDCMKYRPPPDYRMESTASCSRPRPQAPMASPKKSMTLAFASNQPHINMTTTRTFTKTTIVVALSLAFASCKKTSDDPTKNSASTNTELLTSSTWKLSKIEYLQKDGIWITSTLGYKQEGATMSFNADNTYNTFTTNISATNGTWKFSADFGQLSMVNSKTKMRPTFSINTLNKTTLQLGYSGTVIVYGGVDDLERFTYDGERDTFAH